MNFKLIYEEKENFYLKSSGHLLGKGASSCVYVGKMMCKNTNKEEKIAIKEITSKLIFNGDVEKKISLLKSLRHPNIVQFYSSSEEKGYLFMELCESNLENIEISPDNYISYFKQIVEGISYLHANHIIHGDIKPENLLIKNGQIKIADYGISRLLLLGVDASAATFGGSLTYIAPEIISLICMAPEIIRNNVYTEKADIFSLGATLFYLLYKENPSQIFIKMMKEKRRRIKDLNYLGKMYRCFSIFDPFKFVKNSFEISEELKKMIKNCLSDDPQKRPNIRNILDILIIEERNRSLLGKKSENEINSSLRMKELEDQPKFYQEKTNLLSSSTTNPEIEKFFENNQIQKNKKISVLESIYKHEYLNGQKLTKIEEERIKVGALNKLTDRLKKEFESLDFQHFLAGKIKNLITNNSFNFKDKNSLGLMLYFLVKLKYMSSRLMYRRLEKKLNIFEIDNKIWEDFCLEHNYKVLKELNLYLKNISKREFKELTKIITHELVTEYSNEKQKETEEFWKDFKIIIINFVENNSNLFEQYEETNYPIYFVLYGLISIIFSKTKIVSVMEQNFSIKSFEKLFSRKEQRLDAYKMIVNLGKKLYSMDISQQLK